MWRGKRKPNHAPGGQRGPARRCPPNLGAGVVTFPSRAYLAVCTASRFLRVALLGALAYQFGDDVTRLWKRLPRTPRRIALVLLALLLAAWIAAGFLG